MHIPPKRSFHGLQGVPVEHRPYIWMVVSGAAARKAKQVAGYYQAMLHRGQVDSEVAHQIELVRLSKSSKAVSSPQCIGRRWSA